jgi:NAD-dependent dihydropyrimidine dehydrogenase PreA subunit
MHLRAKSPIEIMRAVPYALSMSGGPARSGDRTLGLLAGLAARSSLIDCPLGAFKVEVKWCSGRGECASACLVNVFETDQYGRCVVADAELCFGCMACVAQCLDNGAIITPTKAQEYLSVEELLR